MKKVPKIDKLELWLERHNQFPLLITVSDLADGPRLAKIIGAGLKLEVCLQDHGRAYYLRLEKELKSLAAKHLDFLKKSNKNAINVMTKARMITMALLSHKCKSLNVLSFLYREKNCGIIIKKPPTIPMVNIAGKMTFHLSCQISTDISLISINIGLPFSIKKKRLNRKATNKIKIPSQIYNPHKRVNPRKIPVHTLSLFKMDAVRNKRKTMVMVRLSA